MHAQSGLRCWYYTNILRTGRTKNFDNAGNNYKPCSQFEILLTQHNSTESLYIYRNICIFQANYIMTCRAFDVVLINNHFSNRYFTQNCWSYNCKFFESNRKLIPAPLLSIMCIKTLRYNIYLQNNIKDDKIHISYLTLNFKDNIPKVRT